MRNSMKETFGSYYSGEGKYIRQKVSLKIAKSNKKRQKETKRQKRTF